MVTLFDVLEHVINSSDVVEKASSLLRTSDLLYTYVPNRASASQYLMGKDAQFIRPTRHLAYFTQVTITDFANAVGLKY